MSVILKMVFWQPPAQTNVGITDTMHVLQAVCVILHPLLL